MSARAGRLLRALVDGLSRCLQEARVTYVVQGRFVDPVDVGAELGLAPGAVTYLLEYQLFDQGGRASSVTFRGSATWLLTRSGERTLVLGKGREYRVAPKATAESLTRFKDFVAGVKAAVEPRQVPEWPRRMRSEEWAEGFRIGLKKRRK